MRQLWMLLIGATVAAGIRVERVEIKPIERSEYGVLLEEVKAAIDTLPEKWQVIPATVLFGVTAEIIPTVMVNEEENYKESANSVFFGDEKEHRVYWTIYINRVQQDQPYYVRMEPRKFPWPDKPTPEDDRTAEEIRKMIASGHIAKARNATEAWARKNLIAINEGGPFEVGLPDYPEGGI